MVPEERRKLGPGHAPHVGQVLEAGDDVAAERRARGRRGRDRPRIDADQQDVIHIEAGVHGARAPDAVGEHPGAGQQHETAGDLHREEGVASPSLDPAQLRSRLRSEFAQLVSEGQLLLTLSNEAVPAAAQAGH